MLSNKIKKIESRVTKIEQQIKNHGREEMVAFRAKNKTEFNGHCEEYMKTNPEPELFVCLVDFSELYEIHKRGGNCSEWSFENEVLSY